MLLGRVASAALGRVARVNAGRTAVATGDRGGLQYTERGAYRTNTLSYKASTSGLGFLSKYSWMSREVSV